MLAVLIVFFLNLIIVFALGSWWQKSIFKNRYETVQFLLFNGLLIYLLLIWTLLFFTGFYWEWQLLMLAVSSIYLWKNPNYIKLYWNKFKGLSKLYKISFGLTSLVALALTSAYSSLPDNESYYIQTIKWANEQGFVKGLMNVHPFLGQFSGWHILQAGFNFHNLLLNFTFNDLNALFLLIFAFYWLWEAPKNYQKNYWWQLMPIVAVLLLFFLDSPSPDLPIVLLSLIVFDLFIRYYDQADASILIEIFLLALFSFLIKPTGAVNLFLVFILLFKHRKVIQHQKKLIGLFGIFTLFLWFGKNYIISGYTFYPFRFFGTILHPEWQYPKSLMAYLSQLGHQESGALNFDGNLWGQIQLWLNQPGFHKIMNHIFVFLLLVYPINLIYRRHRFQNLTAYWILYFSGTIYFVFLLFFAPNFRFFLAFFIFMALVIKSQWRVKSLYPVFNLFGIGLFILLGIYFTKKHHFATGVQIVIPLLHPKRRQF